MAVNPDEMTWVCDVCGDVRLDRFISVHTIDISTDLKLPPGTAKRNFKYCNDRQECVDGVLKKKGI